MDLLFSILEIWFPSYVQQVEHCKYFEKSHCDKKQQTLQNDLAIIQGCLLENQKPEGPFDN
jgi:hypothetical protein